MVFSSNETFLALELSWDRGCRWSVEEGPGIREESDLEKDLNVPCVDFSTESFLPWVNLSLEGFLLRDDLSIEPFWLQDNLSTESYLPPWRESALSFLLSLDRSVLGAHFYCRYFASAQVQTLLIHLVWGTFCWESPRPRVKMMVQRLRWLALVIRQKL